jgi:hypothetical protein
MEEHAIRTDLRLVPGLRTEQTGFADEAHSTGEELVEVLDGHFDRLLSVSFDEKGVAVDFRVAPQSGE